MNEKYIDQFENIYQAIPQGKIFRIQFDNKINSLKIISNRHDAFEELRNAFSVENPGAFFSERYGYNAPKKIYAINKFGYFSSGLFFEIIEWLNNSYGSLQCLSISQNCMLYINEILLPLKNFIKENGQFEISNISDDSGKNNQLKNQNKNEFKFRDYQIKSIEKLLFDGYGRGLIECPTGSGKSFIIGNLIWNIQKHINLNMKFLILVPNVQLVEQFYSDLIDYGFNNYDISKFRGGMTKKEKEENNILKSKIIITNRQFLFKNFSTLPKVDCLICDEVHTACASSTSDFINNINCKYKFGCSGTIPRNKYQRWNLIGMFGKIVFQQDIVSLQKKGYISNLKLTLLKITDITVENNRNLLFNVNSFIKYKPDEFGNADIMFNDAYNAEKDYFNKFYNELYKPVFEYLKNLNSNTLLLFDRIEIGKNVFECAQKIFNNKNVYYIDGSINVKKREDIRSKFELCDGNILIAQNAIMSTGVNIKRLENLIFLTGSKSFARTIQSIGRTLRLHESKKFAHIIDISYNFKYSQKHLKERLKMYKEMYNKIPDNIEYFTI